MMYRTLSTIILITIVLLIPGMVLGQCCDVPNGSPYLDNLITWDGEDILGETVTYNGTLFVDGTMRIIDSTVIFEGKGLVLNSTGTLEVVNSTLRSHSSDHGFYLDLMGRSFFDDVTIDGCIDQENGYFGLYIENDLFKGKDLVMDRSGMIRLDGGDIELDGAVINGIMSYSGNMTMNDTLIELTGLTQYGPGTVFLRNVEVTTNISFSQTAGISSLLNGDIVLENVTVGGTYNAGISIVSSSLDIIDSSIELDDGIFGIRATDSTIHRMEKVAIVGTGTGLEAYNCTFDGPIIDSSIDTTYLGLSLNGNNPVTVDRTFISNSSYGMTSSAPLEMVNLTLVGNQVGLLLEGGSITRMEGCTFKDFGQWAIEDETWDQRSYSENTFIPTNSSMGTIAWWGWTTIEVYGPGDIPVSGAEVIIESSLGSRIPVQGNIFGAIWGYLGLQDDVNGVIYTAEVSWGSAFASMNFTPQEDTPLLVHLPLTDLWVKEVVHDGDTIEVTVKCNGSEAKEMNIQLVTDGKLSSYFRTNINASEEKTISFKLMDVDPGYHEIEVSVWSNDEYSGMDGYLLENNGMKVGIEVPMKERDANTYVFIWGLVVLMIVTLVIIILLQKKD